MNDYQKFDECEKGKISLTDQLKLNLTTITGLIGANERLIEKTSGLRQKP